MQCELPAKRIENVNWSPGVAALRQLLYLHTGLSVDEDLFRRDGTLDVRYWSAKFGEQGAALAALMPKHRDEYPQGAIIGRARLADVVTSSDDLWFRGPYGLVLAEAVSLAPIPYKGQLKIFRVPTAVLPEDYLYGIGA